MTRTLTALARQQYGLISHRQAIASGLSAEAIRHRLRRGQWVRIRRGVYVVDGAPASWEQSVLAAVLACGPNAFASHATAARLWGYSELPTDPFEVTVPLGRVVRLAGVRAHRSGTVTDADVRVAGGIPVLCAARVIVDLSSRFDDLRLGAMIDDGLRRRVLSLPALRAVAARLPTIAPGRSPRRMQRLLSARLVDHQPGDSELENRVRRALVDAGLPEPVRQHRVVVDGRVYFVDLAYPEHRIAIEVDGFDFHRGRDVFDRDRRRQNDLVRAGLTVVRFTSTSCDDEIVAVVRDLLCVR